MAAVPTWEWVTLFWCVVFSGYFSGSETAYASVSRAKLETILKGRGHRWNATQIWLNNPSGLLTSILIGNNLVNIGASALATDIASRLFPGKGIPVAVGVTTLVILVFGEITPKVMARRYALVFIKSVAFTLALFYYLTWPVTRFFVWMAHSLIRATGGDPEQEFTPVEAEEIELLVASSAREGGIEKHPAALIDRVFSFGRRTVKDIMVPRTEVVGIDQNEDVDTVADLARRSGHSRLPVYQETMDKIVGIFHVKDLLLRPSEKREDYRLKHHLHPPYYVPETATLGQALRDFQKRRIHMAIVVDEFGGTEGIITLEDILEELVGEIQDEFDRDAVMIRRLPSGSLEVAGLTTIEDLKRVMPELKKKKIPSKTVGGLIMEAMGKVPESGESVELMGIRFTVISSSERQIKRVKVEPLDENNGSSPN